MRRLKIVKDFTEYLKLLLFTSHTYRFRNFQAKLYIIPPFSDYQWSNHSTVNNLFNEVQQLNASMAIQLSWNWLRHNSKIVKNTDLIELLPTYHFKPFLKVTSDFVTGLENFSWPGRFQILQRKKQRLFIDGAHTLESLKVCFDWFKAKTDDR